METRRIGGAQETARYHIYPFRTSSLAASAIAPSVLSTSSAPSTSPALSHEAPSYQNSAASYETPTSWLDDTGSKSPSLQSANSPQTPTSPATVDYSSFENSSYDHACEFDADDWFSRFKGDIDISDDLPNQKTLGKAGDIPVYDSAGNSRLFRSLYSVGDVVGDRQLIIFIRHFYCGACQAYIRALTQQINMQTYFTMAIPTSIIVIGCGSPEMIRQYKAITQCPFPIFADPTRQLFRHLGMSLSLNIGLLSKRPEYMKEVNPVAWLNGQLKDIAKARGMKKFRGGNWLQIGGEFLFQDGGLVWCHRMKNYRNHAEIDVIKRILEIER